MKRAFVVLGLCLAAGAAAADGALPSAPGRGWSGHVGPREALEHGHLGGAQIDAEQSVIVLYQADDGTAGMATWRVVARAVRDPAQAARAELDGLRGDRQIAGAAAKTPTEETSWHEGVDAAAHAAEGTVAWRASGAATEARARALVTATADRVEAVGAQCVFVNGGAAKHGAECDAFLAALAPTTPADQRVAIALASAGAAASAPTSSGAPAPTMSETHGDRLPPPPPAPPEPADRRPLYLAGGAVVLALIFLWNRQRARKLEEDHGPTAPRQRRWRVKGDDDDADALARAAAGDDDDNDDHDDHDDAEKKS